MKPAVRSAFCAASAALLVSASAFAAEPYAAADPTLIGPPPPPVVAPPAPVAAAPAPPPAAVAAAPTPAPRAAGSARPAPWLRQPARPAADKLETKAPMSPVRVGMMLLLVALLGGAAYYAHKRRKVAPAAVASEKLKVLGSTRVGPKALAVVAEVGGKRLLLGVTDQSVNTLAWLDSDDSEEGERASVERPSRPAPIRRDADEAVQGPSGFLRVLRKAVGSGERSVAVDEIAKRTRDEVTLSRRSKPESLEELEGQVKGLARRRREPS
jgi:flagellar biogenesis protein FliO